MKVRVKLGGRAQAVDVGDIQQCTLSQLRRRTADVFELDETPFTLSLNRKNSLSGEDQTLSQLGIVAGDLIFVLSPEVPASPATSVSSCASNGSAQDVVSHGEKLQAMGLDAVPESMSTACPEHNSASAANNGWTPSGLTEQHEDLAAPSTSQQDRRSPSPCPLEDPEVNRCLQEPMLCRESTATSVPVLLRDMYTSAGCVNASDALWVALHTLMMEMGFRLHQEDDFGLAPGWNRRGFYRQEYQHLCVSAPHSCCLMGVPMGQLVIVHGVTNGVPPLKTDPQSLKVTDYVQDNCINQDVCSVYKNLERLSRIVKDSICQCLMSQLSEVCGFPLSVGLLSLSYEIKLKILSYLDVSSLARCGQVGRGLSVAYKDPYLWRRLYLKEFGQNGDNSLNKNWYQLFKDAYQLRKERRRISRHRHLQSVTAVPPWLHIPPGFTPPMIPPYYPGGLIGGDYDLNPEFSSSIAHPLTGQPMVPNPFLPGPGAPFLPRPRFDDPFGPDTDPGPPFMSLRGGGNRGRHSNHRSSPFSSLGGRPRFF